MTIEISPLTEADIPAAIEVIQKAFAEDPYFLWVFDKAQVSPSFAIVVLHPTSARICWLTSILIEGPVDPSGFG